MSAAFRAGAAGIAREVVTAPRTSASTDSTCPSKCNPNRERWKYGKQHAEDRQRHHVSSRFTLLCMNVDERGVLPDGFGVCYEK